MEQAIQNAAPGGERRALLLTLLMPAVFLLAYLLEHWEQLSTLCEQAGDYALILLEVENAKKWEALTGPYSRFHFRHPGPLAFYLYALLDPLFSGLSSAQARASAVQLVLNMLFAAAALLCITAHTRKPLLSGLLFVCYALYVRRAMSGAWHEIWGPATLLAPALCFLVTSASLATGSAFFFFFWIAGAAFALSNHVGSASLVVPIGSLCALLFLRRRMREPGEVTRLEIVSIGAGCALAVLAALPIFVDALDDGGNVRRLIEFFIQPGRRALGLREAINFSAYYYAAPLFSWRSLRLPLAILIIVLPFAGRFAPASFLSGLRLVTSITAVCLVLGAAGIVGEPRRSLMMFGFAAGGLTLFLGLAAAASRIPAPRPGLGAALVVLLFTAILYLGKEARAVSMPCPRRYQEALSWIAPQQGVMHRIDMERREQWKMLAALVLQLYRSGAAVCVPSEWRFMFGTDLVCRETASARPTRFFKIVSAKAARPGLPTFVSGRFVLQERTRGVVE